MALVKKQFSEVITMERATSAWCYGPDKVYKEVAANLPRLDHDPVTGEPLGILVEEARTNLWQYSSENYVPSYNPKQVILVPSYGVAPDGLMKSYRVLTPAGGCVFNLMGHGANADTQGNAYVSRVHIKPKNMVGTLAIYAGDSTSTGGASFNLSIASVGATPTISNGGKVVPVGNGWFDIQMPYVASANNANPTLVINFQAGSPANDFEVWGRGREVGTFATSYIPTPAIFQSRASTATYIDSTGTLQTAAANVARDQAYGYDEYGVLRKVGLLVEGQATNLIKNSQAVGASGDVNPPHWSQQQPFHGISISERDTLAFPSGVTGFKYRVVGTTQAITNKLLISPTANREAVTAGTTYTLSWRMRKLAGVYTWGIQIEMGWYDSTGTIISTDYSSLQSVGDSETRHAFTGVAPTGATTVNIRFNHARQGTAVEDVDFTLLVGGVQLETGSVATSYIPTTTAQVTRAADITTSSQVTRAADNVSVNDLAPWYRADEGTLFVDVGSFNGSSARSVTLNDGTVQNQIWIRPSSGDSFAGYKSGVFHWQVTIPGGGSAGRYAGAYKLNDIATSRNGSAVMTDTSAEIPVVSKMRIGASWDGAVPLNGHIRSIRYYPTRLPDAELQSLTA